MTEIFFQSQAVAGSEEVRVAQIASVGQPGVNLEAAAVVGRAQDHYLPRVLNRVVQRLAEGNVDPVPPAHDVGKRAVAPRVVDAGDSH
jgi:hypothetical protein